MDRPDERSGSQVHVVYALPSDAVDRALDGDGTIAASVANFQGWLRGQTGGAGLRLDTYQGEPDVSFFRLSATDAQLAMTGLLVRDAIEREMRSAGFAAPKKIYAVYYDGSNTAACGGGAWPPALTGTVGAVYMRATFGAGFPCYDPTQSRARLQIMDLAILHEMIHVLGFVRTCAPHHTRSGHVSDSPNDLMYAGDAPWTPSVLDVNRDDYFGAENADCPGLERSAFLEGNDPFALEVRVESAGGSGGVASAPAGLACPTTCSAAFDRGSIVTLTATPSAGSVFAGWSGACSGPEPACTMTMDSAKSVTATFAAARYRLNVSVRGPGRVVGSPAGISCPRRCAATYAAGTRVVLRPVPSARATFRGWAGACRGKGRCTVVMDGPRRAVATFGRR